MAKVIIPIGRLGKAPEKFVSDKGNTVVTLSVAEYIDKNTTQWWTVKVFGKAGESCLQYTDKGKRVYVEGRYSERKYTKKDNTEGMSVEVLADNVRFIDFKENVTEGDAEQPTMDKPPF